MRKRAYYSARTGRLMPDRQMSLELLKRLFLAVYEKLLDEGYFQKYFGIKCTDGYVAGKLGHDVAAMAFISLRKEHLFPIEKNIDAYSEDDLFDIIEFLHDNSSKGIECYYHSWNECGNHFTSFNDEQGQLYFREALNPILEDYRGGFEISKQGEILILTQLGFSNLFDAVIPFNDEPNVNERINHAIVKFRTRSSTVNERREAVRELADVLEFLRPTVKANLLTKDEKDLFNIINNFGIRHHNLDQKTDYNKEIWFNWMFYFNLSTIHAVLRYDSKKIPEAQSVFNN